MKNSFNKTPIVPEGWGLGSVQGRKEVTTEILALDLPAVASQSGAHLPISKSLGPRCSFSGLSRPQYVPRGDSKEPPVVVCLYLFLPQGGKWV